MITQLLIVLSIAGAGNLSLAQDFGALKEKVQGVANGTDTIAGMDRAAIEAKIKELTAKKSQSKDPMEKKGLDAQISELKKKLAEMKGKK